MYIFSFADVHLSLCKLGPVNICSLSRMKAIAALCPNLEEIILVWRNLKEADQISVGQLELVLALLPQVISKL